MSGSRRRPVSAGADNESKSDNVIGAPLTGTRSLRGLDRYRSPQIPQAPRPLRRLPPASEAIYDWNTSGPLSTLPLRTIELCDETLRDGIQSPSVTDPSVDDKIALMHLMDELGIDAITVGLPAAGERAYADSLALCREAAASGVKASINLSARTVVDDLKPIVDIQQKTGLAVTAYTFIGSSPILFAEGWSVTTLLERIDEALSFAAREGLAVCLITEDTTRAQPEVLDPIYRAAIDLGAARLCLCDTVGHATPEGVRGLVSWAKNLIRGSGAEVGLDWHGHNDRGLAVINAMVALEAGADRAHGTALGMGERVGNAAMDQLLINLKLAEAYDHDISALSRYCELASKACGMPIAPSYPVFGRDAFRTGTGVHAAAIVKARRKGESDYADRVYSSVPASWVGREQLIEVSHMSGASNVVHWLESRGFRADDGVVRDIMQHAKGQRRTLEDNELVSMLNARGVYASSVRPVFTVTDDVTAPAPIPMDVVDSRITAVN
jgi:isopropylmalate/homocitrate/citramalate synthase